MICMFIEFTTDLKTHEFNPGFHVMENEASTALKKTMADMYINYHLLSPGNHGSNNAEIESQTFNNHLLSVLCSLYADFHLQL